LFPRSKRRHFLSGADERLAKVDSSGLLRNLPKAPIEEEEMYLANSKVVDGWSGFYFCLLWKASDSHLDILEEAYPLESSREQTPDLVAPSSSVWTDMPSTPPEMDGKLYPEKMGKGQSTRSMRGFLMRHLDEILFPRVPKLGLRGSLNMEGWCSFQLYIPALTGSLISFHDLVKMIPPSVDRPGPVECVPYDEVSLVPQPSSAGGEEEASNDYLMGERDEVLGLGLDSWITDICEKQIGSTPYNYLLDEKLDEKHAFLLNGKDLLYCIFIVSEGLRIVPRLQNPPFGCSTLHLHANLPSLVLREQNSQGAEGSCEGFLKKVPGVQSLNLELSWRYVRRLLFLVGLMKLPIDHSPMVHMYPPMQSYLTLAIRLYLARRSRR
jgi:hypothetical protein